MLNKDGAFYHVAQLAHVSRPVENHQSFQGLGLKMKIRPGVFLPELSEKMLDEQGNVLPPVPLAEENEWR